MPQITTNNYKQVASQRSVFVQTRTGTVTCCCKPDTDFISMLLALTQNNRCTAADQTILVLGSSLYI